MPGDRRLAADPNQPIDSLSVLAQIMPFLQDPNTPFQGPFVSPSGGQMVPMDTMRRRQGLQQTPFGFENLPIQGNPTFPLELVDAIAGVPRR